MMKKNKMGKKVMMMVVMMKKKNHMKNQKLILCNVRINYKIYLVKQKKDLVINQGNFLPSLLKYKKVLTKKMILLLKL
jgi:hypothetical protein